MWKLGSRTCVSTLAGSYRRPGGGIINGCITLQPDAALANALLLLYKAFGSPDVTVKAHLKSVTEGPTICTDKRSLQDFYSDLVNCKYVLESAGAFQQLNAAATLEGVFGRLPRPELKRGPNLPRPRRDETS